MVTYRRAGPEDALLLARTRRTVWQETYRGIYPDELLDAYDVEAHAKKDAVRLADPKHRYYLFLDGAECAGYFSFGPGNYGPYKDFDLCLNHLYIRQPYKGRGLGREAFRCIRTYCREQGISKFYCGCNAHNRPALEFYAHMGGVPGHEVAYHENKYDDILHFEFSRLEYRRALYADAALIAVTRQKAWASTYRGIYPEEMIENFDYKWHTRREQQMLENPMVHSYLVMDGTECAGYFTYFIKENPLWRDFHVRLFSLYLLPQYQGGGAGRAIFEFVAGQCRRAGYEKLYLSCAPQNKKAMGFYKHLGGRVVDEDTGHENPAEDTVEFEFYV